MPPGTIANAPVNSAPAPTISSKPLAIATGVPANIAKSTGGGGGGFIHTQPGVMGTLKDTVKGTLNKVIKVVVPLLIIGGLGFGLFKYLKWKKARKKPVRR